MNKNKKKKKKNKMTNNQPTPNGGEIVIFKNEQGNFELEARFKDETVWLSQQQIAELFGTKRPAIAKHLQNIFKTAELSEDSVCSILEHTAGDGKKYKVQFYNLDAILSIGYRVNSKQATTFRIWATQVLHNHLVQGFTINQKRLEEQQAKLAEMQKAIAFIREKSRRPGLTNQAEELLSVIQDYASSLTIFYKYDQSSLELKHSKKARFVLTHDIARQVINTTKEKLLAKKEAGDLFGQEYGDKFKSILGALYQTFGGQELYSSLEEKAANLLYLTIKDHPFADGNKRTGSLLFVYFLDRNRYLWSKTGERKITDTTLVALALLIAESDPKEKETMIKLVTNLLV